MPSFKPLIVQCRIFLSAGRGRGVERGPGGARDRARTPGDAGGSVRRCVPARSQRGGDPVRGNGRRAPVLRWHGGWWLL